MIQDVRLKTRFGALALVERSLISRVLQRYWRLSRGLTLGAQGVVLDGDNRVLLIRHGYRPGWHFPGGGVEKSETLDLSLRRELMEEAGIVIEGKPQLFGVYANFQAFPNDHIILYIIRQWRQPAIPKPNAEIAEQGFFAFDQLPTGTTRATRARLAEIIGGVTPSMIW